MRAILAFMTTVLTVALAVAPSEAFVIDFVGLDGGTVSYAGGPSPLVGSWLPISQVFGIPPGSSSSTPVSSGVLSFTTGLFSSSVDLPGDSFVSFYGSGGSLTVTGGVLAAGIADGSLLLQAAFVGAPALFYSGLGMASLSGSLALLFVNPDLTKYLGFGSDPTYYLGPGGLAQAEFNLAFAGSVAPESSFSGQQASVNLTVTVPQPTPLVFLGLGLVGIGVWARVQRARHRWRVVS
jgi:hypothetical protein